MVHKYVILSACPHSIPKGILTGTCLYLSPSYIWRIACNPPRGIFTGEFSPKSSGTFEKGFYSNLTQLFTHSKINLYILPPVPCWL